MELKTNFEFEKYSIGADDIKYETEQLLKKSEATPHAEILHQLIEQFEPLDFEALANPNNAENFKLNMKHFLVLSIENTLQFAEKNRWGLCKNHDFIYLCALKNRPDGLRKQRITALRQLRPPG